MKKNPYTSKVFTSIWLKHFYNGQKSETIKAISGLKFINHSVLPILINVGKTNTKGLTYKIDKAFEKSFRKKVLLIYDVPTYLSQNDNAIDNSKVYKVKQYPGFLVKLKNYTSLEKYLLENLSKSSKQKIFRYKRRLELCFEIKYKVFFGEISKEEYDEVFYHFKRILLKRFDDKQISNNNLDDHEWNFYYEVTYPMILEKKAALFVTFDNNIPIAITLQNFSEETVFDVIRTFDIDYAKFHLGSVSVLNLIEWCINSNYKMLDFSKGEYEYKRSWCTDTYNYEYHIIFDSKSLRSIVLATLIKGFFNFKNYLRDKNINEVFHKIRYFLNNENTPKSDKSISYNFIEENDKFDMDDLIEIEMPQNNDSQLNIIFNEYLYLNSEKKVDVRLFSIRTDNSLFLIKGKQSQKVIQRL